MANINRLEVLEKRAEIAQIKEVLKLRSSAFINTLLNTDSFNEDEMYGRLVELEEDLENTKLRLI